MYSTGFGNGSRALATLAGPRKVEKPVVATQCVAGIATIPITEVLTPFPPFTRLLGMTTTARRQTRNRRSATTGQILPFTRGANLLDEGRQALRRLRAILDRHAAGRPLDETAAAVAVAEARGLAAELRCAARGLRGFPETSVGRAA